MKLQLGQQRRNVNREFINSRMFGERLSDRVAAFSGSWTFIVLFGAFMVMWALLNTDLLRRDAFDPYPYVFLDLILSMLAAIQAPIIMMSQNRQAERDRLAAASDYEINLKAELEITGLHDKLDRMRQEHLSEIVALQKEQLVLLKGETAEGLN